MIFIFRGANLEGSDTYEKLVQTMTKTNIPDKDHFNAIVSIAEDPSYLVTENVSQC